MVQIRPSAELPLTIARTPVADKNRLCLFSLLSGFVHITLLGVFMAWIGGRAEFLLPVQVITIDLARMDNAPASALPQVVRSQPRSIPRLSRMPTIIPEKIKTRTVPETSSAATATMLLGSQGQYAGTSHRPSAHAPGPSVSAAPSPSTAPPYVPPVGRIVETASIRATYLHRCRGLIERYKEYPIMARKGRIEGTVIVRGTLGHDGILRQCILSRSSGSGMLDNAALQAVRSVEQFPAIPPELPNNELVFEVPISFRLSDE